MNSRIFRKVSIERLSSPEQLDQLLTVTGPRGWAALLAALLFAAVIVTWSVVGTIPSTSAGAGIIVRSGGVLNVVSRGSGLIVELTPRVGDHVRANEVVAVITQPGMAEKLKALREGLSQTKREQDRALEYRKREAQLQIEAIERQKANTTREIRELEAQAQFASEQIPVADQLYKKGLITKQQTISAREKLIAIQAQVATAKAQLTQFDAQQYSAQNQVQQAEAQMALQLGDLSRNLRTFEHEVATVQTVVTPYAGQVLELKASAGGIVGENAPILSIQPDDNLLEALIYLPAAQAKDARIGMDVEISPSTVKREEFGFMVGKIAFVADYPATTAALMRNFQNETLISALTQAGPVTEVRASLSHAPTTSGFQWSSVGGPPLKISSGTLCAAQVITRRQAPITLLIPFFRDRLGVS